MTTDNGGCREYAIDGETALVVPPRDARAMADAIRRLLDDDALAARLVANGLEVVERDFDWERRTDEFEAVLDGLSAEPAAAPPPTRPAAPTEPELSVVVLAWNNLLYTQQFVDSVRRNTDVPYELVIVDNGSEWEAANYARAAADRVVLNDDQPRLRRGHEPGSGGRARSLRRVLQQRHDRSRAGGPTHLLADRALPSERGDRRARPSPTTRNPVNVRTEPGDRRRGAPAVQRAARRDRLRHAGRGRAPARRVGRGVRDRERRRRRPVRSRPGSTTSTSCTTSACSCSTSGRDRRREPRRLAGRSGRGTAAASSTSGWATARCRASTTCDPARFARNRETARAVAGWMDRYFTVRDREDRRLRRFFAKNGPVRTHLFGWAHAGWRRVRPRLPPAVANRLGAAARRVE